MQDATHRARASYARRAWEDAFTALTEASAEGALDAEDLERLAWSATLSGHEQASVDALERLHRLHLEAGRALPAARSALWLTLRLMPLGERARASGWLTTAQRLVERAGPTSVESGYLLLPQVFRLTGAGDFAAARAMASEAVAIADRHADPDLRAFATSLNGRACLRLGQLAEGLALLDEAMLTVTGGDVSPVVAGIIYCSVIAGCQQSHALDRAREWTAALTDWCEAQPQLVQFAGACLVHRSEILQLGGAWPEAIEAARRACARLAPTKDAEAGNAFYQEGELHRVRGELAEAEQAYARASERGRDPQPGLALLRLGQGRVDLAAAASRRVLAALTEPLLRTRVLPAHVEISLAASELEEARRAVEELRALAGRFAMETLSATAAHAEAAVMLAEGDARGAIEPLRRAQQIWQRVGAPYPGARIRVLLARAFLALGDADGARLELAGARKTFTELGAAPDVAVIDALEAAPARARAPSAERGAHGLSPRELEVLLLVASGKTNKLIAKQLFVSEKTVDRHVSNLFRKLNVPTRAAATAWAFKKGLVPSNG